MSMVYTLGNKCAKNLCKRTVLLQLIIKNVVAYQYVFRNVNVVVCMECTLHYTVQIVCS